MVVIMLVGAWLLIHQQCCVTGEVESRLRSPVIDQLSRRSALEKNFMRFGRSSWGPANEDKESKNGDDLLLGLEGEKAKKFVDSGTTDPEDQLRFSRSNDNFLRFGRDVRNQVGVQDYSTLSPIDESHSFPPLGWSQDDFLRLRRVKDNFLRFGRIKQNFLRFGRGKSNFLRLGRAKDNFLRFGRGKDNHLRFGRTNENFMRFGRDKFDDNRFEDAKEDFSRLGRSKDNFMRLGRSRDDFTRPRRPKENFMRFGRNDNENGVAQRFKRSIDGSFNGHFIRSLRDKTLIRFGRQRQTDKGDGFIRFGRSIHGEPLAVIDNNIEPTIGLIGLRDFKQEKRQHSNSYHNFTLQTITEPKILIGPAYSFPPKTQHTVSASRNLLNLK